ncbi:MAG: PQQ-binding-like beta-propeller repeat protein [Acidobacteriota bacterium]
MARVLLAASLAAAPLWADDWPQWRGPTRDGHAPHFEAPAAWPDSLRREWRVEVGEGYASPVVSGDRIFLMTRRGEDEVAMALSARDGAVLWTSRFATPFTAHPSAVRFGEGPKATPAAAASSSGSGPAAATACFLGINGRFSCHDAGDGEVLWTRDFSGRISQEKFFCGSAVSPLIDGDTVYFHLGDDLSGTLFAADLRSGENRWTWEGQGPGYASPFLLEAGGARTLVVFATTDLVGLNPQTGKLLWSRPFADRWRENIVDPLVVGERLLISDYENGTVALWPRRSADGWRVEELWHNPQLTQRMASPVAARGGEIVYGFSDRRRGQLYTLDPASGEVLWSSRGRGGDHASLTVIDGGWLMVASTTGELSVMEEREGGALALVKRYDLAESPVWAQLAWLPGAILVKDERHLARLSFPRVDPKAAEREAP